MHVSVHVRSGDPKSQERRLTTHSALVYVALGADGRPTPVRPWEPVTEEDVALDAHARRLIELRAAVGS
jgi:4-hydroxybenzoyl-CoA thioesterase